MRLRYAFFYWIFGKRIKELRKKQKLTQERLAEILDVDSKTISRLEKGYYFTTYENLEKLSKALGVEIKDFFDFKHLKDKEELQSLVISKVKTLPHDNLQKLAKFIQDYLWSSCTLGRSMHQSPNMFI